MEMKGQREKINEIGKGKLRLSSNRKLVRTTKVKPPDRFCQWKSPRNEEEATQGRDKVTRQLLANLTNYTDLFKF